MSEEKTEAELAAETCMCGDPMEGHSTLSGHTPVSMADYYGQAEARQLREALYRAEEKQAAMTARTTRMEEALKRLLAVVDKQSDALNDNALSDAEIWEWAEARENARAALKSPKSEHHEN